MTIIIDGGMGGRGVDESLLSAHMVRMRLFLTVFWPKFPNAV
jgi:hypothetical protein